MREDLNLVSWQPFNWQLCSVTSCSVLLENYLASWFSHPPVVVEKNLVQDLVLVPLCSHTTTFSTWIVQDNKWPLAPLHNATPYHDLEGRLFECWDSTAFIVLIANSSCYPHCASIVTDVDIALVGPNNSFPIFVWPLLMFLHPFLSTYFMLLSKVDNLLSPSLL